jgi:hypothetical protein
MYAKVVARLAKLRDYKVISKTFVLASDLLQLMKVANKERSDGFIFTPLNKPISLGTVHDCLKWKPVDKQTVDLIIKQTVEDGKYSLHASKNELVNYAKIDKSIILVSLQLSLKLAQRDHKLLLVECKRIGQQWYPIFINGQLLVRNDKPNANSLFVVKKTEQAIADNISPANIVAICRNNRR